MMELENLKEIWSDLDQRLQQPALAGEARILEMAHRRSRSGLERVIRLEVVGSLFSTALVVLLLLYFHRLETGLQITGGIGTVVILLTGIALSLRIIWKARRIDLAGASYQVNRRHFASLKQTLRLYKKLSIVLNIVLPFLMLPVVFKLFLARDLLNDLPTFGKTLLLCAALTAPVLWLVIRYYRKNITQVRKSLEATEPTTNKKDEI